MADKLFAIMDDSNTVTNVMVVDATDEADGISKVRTIIDNPTAVVAETFENASDASTRYNYARIGGTWDPSNSAFINPQEYPSWTLDSSFQWAAPIAKPTTDYVGDLYLISEWDEAGQKWNGLNTTTNVVEYVWNPSTLAWDPV